jgi:ABC-2 type transport system ATP-binding protein
MLEGVRIAELKIVRGGKTIIPNLSIQIERGKIVGLLGPSGSGKTTILRSIVGVQAIQGGSITVLGQPAGSQGLRNRIGYFTQNASIYTDLTCIENLRFFAQVLGESEISIDEILEMVDLTKNRKQLATSLSGGERARLALLHSSANLNS